MAMGQNPNRTPSEHPNPTIKIGSKMGGEFAYQPKMGSQKGFDNHSHIQVADKGQLLAIFTLCCAGAGAAGSACGWVGASDLHQMNDPSEGLATRREPRCWDLFRAQLSKANRPLDKPGTLALHLYATDSGDICWKNWSAQGSFKRWVEEIWVPVTLRGTPVVFISFPSEEMGLSLWRGIPQNGGFPFVFLSNQK